MWPSVAILSFALAFLLLAVRRFHEHLGLGSGSPHLARRSEVRLYTRLPAGLTMSWASSSSATEAILRYCTGGPGLQPSRAPLLWPSIGEPRRSESKNSSVLCAEARCSKHWGRDRTSRLDTPKAAQQIRFFRACFAPKHKISDSLASRWISPSQLPRLQMPRLGLAASPSAPRKRSHRAPPAASLPLPLAPRKRT
jgi:hypothetical protein